MIICPRGRERLRYGGFRRQIGFRESRREGASGGDLHSSNLAGRPGGVTSDTRTIQAHALIRKYAEHCLPSVLILSPLTKLTECCHIRALTAGRPCHSGFMSLFGA